MCVWSLPQSEASHWLPRYLVLSISLGSGGNRLWYVPLAALPVSAASGALDLGRYDMRLPAERRAALPLGKLVDDLRATWSVVATNNTQWTLHTSYNAARYRCGLIGLERASCSSCSIHVHEPACMPLLLTTAGSAESTTCMRPHAVAACVTASPTATDVWAGALTRFVLCLLVAAVAL